MSTFAKTNRRNFLKMAATASGGLMLGFHWSTSEAFGMEVIQDRAFAAGDINFNSYLSISPDDVITIFSPNPELGQNIKTSFPMVVAEELDADWRKVKVEQADLDTKKFERQLTGGSGAVPHSWIRLRQAGATARQMLIEAGAKRWSVASSSVTAENGFVIHRESGKKLTYGELATEASPLPCLRM
jgi:Aerobic-type carbon monoxide dehydrogenase, large subunit CoxL/CutL homologs